METTNYLNQTEQEPKSTTMLVVVHRPLTKFKTSVHLIHVSDINGCSKEAIVNLLGATYKVSTDEGFFCLVDETHDMIVGDCFKSQENKEAFSKYVHEIAEKLIAKNDLGVSCGNIISSLFEEGCQFELHSSNLIL